MTANADPEPRLFTNSACFYPNYRMPLTLDREHDISRNELADERCRFILIEEGSGCLILAGKTMPFTNPSFLCLRAGERVDEVRSDGYRAKALYFHPAIINGNFAYERLVSLDPPFTGTDSQDMYCIRQYYLRDEYAVHPILLGPQSAMRQRELIDKIGEQLDRTDHDGWPCLTRSYFIELLFYAERLRALVPTPGEIDSDSLVNDVLAFMAANFGEQITIHSLTERFCTNRTTLSQRFAKATGATVVDYLNRLRSHVASLLLRDTALPISDIMYRVGFRDPTHFGRIFRAHYGYTPSDYRKNFSYR